MANRANHPAPGWPCCIVFTHPGRVNVVKKYPLSLALNAHLTYIKSDKIRQINYLTTTMASGTVVAISKNEFQKGK